jgi:beta-lactamase class A
VLQYSQLAGILFQRRMMKRFFSVFAVAAIFAVAVTLVHRTVAQLQLTPATALARVLEQSPAQPEWFDSSFLAQIPTTQIDAIVAQYKSHLGVFQRADATGDGFTVVMEEGTFPAKIVLNAQGKIVGLWFGNPQPLKAASLDDTLKEFSKLPGKISVLVVEDGKPRGSLRSDDPLAVGSTFKLAVLATLAQQIAAGKHRWDEVVPLQPAWKSLPSSVLLDWPDSTPLTLATLANQMISVSDNTAADGLLSIAGRDTVEKRAPRNQPFLSTREAFELKAKANSALLAKFRARDPAGRSALLAEVDKAALPDASEFRGAPVATDVEWFFTARELCSLIAPVADLPAMHINPGVARPADWKQVAFKGGSEPGVLNLTTAVTGKNGRHYCVTASWNDTAPLDQTQFSLLYGRLLTTLAKESAK